MPLEWDLNGEGQPSVKEMNLWSIMDGGDISVEGSSVDFSKSNVKFHTLKNGFDIGYAKLQKDNPLDGASRVYGTLTLLRKGGGAAYIRKDKYNFEMHSWRTDAGRNVETIFGRINAEPFPMNPFYIKFNGPANLNYRPGGCCNK